METKTNQWVYQFDTNYPRKYINYDGEECICDISDVRYVLGEKLNDSKNKALVCVGINPSTAIPFNLDYTNQRIQRYATNHNYNSWYMLNLYPQRATNPNDMHTELNPYIHKKNIDHIEQLLTQLKKEYKEVHVWCAWGNIVNTKTEIARFGFLTSIMPYIIEKFNGFSLFASGETQDNFPNHPRVLRSNQELRRIEVDVTGKIKH